MRYNKIQWLGGLIAFMSVIGLPITFYMVVRELIDVADKYDSGQEFSDSMWLFSAVLCMVAPPIGMFLIGYMFADDYKNEKGFFEK